MVLNKEAVVRFTRYPPGEKEQMQPADRSDDDS
jgi:hypothetical protein